MEIQRQEHSKRCSTTERVNNDPIKEMEQYLLPQTLKTYLPYFENIEATGSILSLYNDYPEVPTFYINYPHFDDCTAYVPMVGDSMFPMYSSGEIIAVKKVDNTDILLWGEAYLVVTNGNANSLRTVKLVHQHEDDSKIILRASNPNYRGDTVLNKADVISMFIVKGRIRRNQL